MFNKNAVPSSGNYSVPNAKDLYELDRLKKSFLTKRFICEELNCNFKTRVINELLDHEILEHKIQCRFYCKKCQGVFTKKVYLDYHQDEQDSGMFLCYKCAQYFKFQHQLDRHLLMHHTMTNEHKCRVCEFKYLSQEDLNEHYMNTSHGLAETGARNVIQIDHSMDIVNKVLMPPPPAPPPKPTITYKIMDLPKVHTRQRTRLYHEQLQPYQRSFGKLEFPKDTEPNCCCWRCR